jgi:hypothetical protein
VTADKMLLRMDAEMRSAILGGTELEGLLEDFGCDGVECEIRGCERESEDFWEYGGNGEGEDGGRNLCLIHWRIAEGWRRSGDSGLTRGLRLRMPFDDGTELMLRHETKELG